MKRRNVVHALGLSMALAAGMGFAGNAEEAQQDEYLSQIQVKNTFEGEIQEKGGIFQSSKRSSDGIGIQSVRRICEKNGGASNFSCENGVFIAQIMLRMDSE